MKLKTPSKHYTIVFESKPDKNPETPQSHVAVFPQEAGPVRKAPEKTLAPVASRPSYIPVSLTPVSGGVLLQGRFTRVLCI